MKPLFAELSPWMRWSGFWLALGAAFVVAPGDAWAVGNDGIFYSRDAADEGAYFSSQNAFRIPFQTDTGDRRIRKSCSTSPPTSARSTKR